MILIDKDKFEEIEYANENELEQMIIEHSNSIFGENSIFLNIKKQIASVLDMRTIPDGYLFNITNHKFYLVEIELAKHDLYDHIVKQVFKFQNAIKNAESRISVARILSEEIKRNIKYKNKIEDILDQKGKELFEFLLEKIEEPLSLIVVINKEIEEMEEIFDNLRTGGIGNIEPVIIFETFYNEKKTNHIHKFIPMIYGEKQQRESKELTLNYHLQNSSNELKEIFMKIRKTTVLNNKDVNENPTVKYIGYNKTGGRTFITFIFKKNKIKANVRIKPKVNSRIKRLLNIRDIKNIGHWGKLSSKDWQIIITPEIKSEAAFKELSKIIKENYDIS